MVGTVWTTFKLRGALLFLYPIKTMKRNLYIGIKQLCEVAQDRDSLAVFAFCLMVKERFVSSQVNNASFRRVQSLFGISYPTWKKITKKGQEMGLIYFVGKDLFCSRIRTKGYNFNYICSEQGKFSEYVKAIREVILINHIAKMEDIQETTQKACLGKRISVVRAARKRLEKLGLAGKVPHYNLSNRRAGEVVGMSKASGRSLLNGLLGKKMVSFTPDVRPTPLSPDCATKEILEYYRQSGVLGHLYVAKGTVWEDMGRIYNLKANPIIALGA